MISMTSLHIGIDIGYGFVKAASSTGGKVSFPSLVTPCGHDPLDGVIKGKGSGYKVRITTNGRREDSLVGEAAAQSLSAQGFVAQQEKPAQLHDTLLLTAAYLQGAGENLMLNGNARLAVGLPLSFYRSQKSALKERLEQLDARLSVDGGPERLISFSRLSVFPQGAGALLSAGKTLPKSGLVGLIDIGTYTSDFLLFDMRNGAPVPIPDACGSIEIGLYPAYRVLAAEFEQQAGATLPPRMYHLAFDHARQEILMSYQGRAIDLHPAWKQAQREIASTITGQVRATWGDRAGFLSMTVFAGGGAINFWESLKGAFPQPRLVEDSFYANALGYLAMITDTPNA
jgi:plasmid segregation protein ParM